MKLFLLTSKSRIGGSWDCMNGVLIRCKSEERAREMASKIAGDEGYNTWLHPELSFCEILTTDGLEEYVIVDFHSA